MPGLGIRLGLDRLNAMPSGFSVSGGGKFYFHEEQITVADGPDAYGRSYHAFPDLTKIGSAYWITYLSSGGHADGRADLVLKKSTDNGLTWTVKKTFAASRPSGTIVNGDIEYRAGSVTDLGGGHYVCNMETYTYVSGALYSNPTGYKTAWSVSHDAGETWSAPVLMTPFDASYYSLAGMKACVWKGTFYMAVYSDNALGAGMWSSPVADLIAGSPVWTTVVADFKQEPCVLINPDDPDELWVTGRTNVSYLNLRKSSDGSTWAAAKQIYWQNSGATSGHKPLLSRTANGNWILPHRLPTDLMEPVVMAGAGPLVEYSGDGTVADELWVNVAQASVPIPLGTLRERGFGGVEKSMYFGMTPLGGDLMAMAYAVEPKEQWNGTTALTGRRSSVFFGWFGAGSGRTPVGAFVPAPQDLRDGVTIDLADTSTSYQKWMTADTEILVIDGSETVELELFGDYVPTFRISGGAAITPTGAYDPDAKNIATISPGPVVSIANSAPPSPMEIPGLAARTMVQLSPSGILTSGANVTGWTNEGDTTVISAYGASTVKPTLSAASTPNGNASVQGSDAAYLTGPADAIVHAVYALASYPTADWKTNYHYQALVYAAISGPYGAGRSRWTSPPWGVNSADFKSFDHNGIRFSVATEDQKSLLGWNIYSARIRSTTDGATTSLVFPTVATRLSELMIAQGDGLGWQGKLAAFLVIKNAAPSDREDILIRRWMRSL